MTEPAPTSGLVRSATADAPFTSIRPTEDFHCGQVPGYLGFCPQVKYNYGKTFANQTRDLAKEFPHRHIEHKEPVEFVDKFRNRLPEASGQNRYTKDIIPGYSGFVPELTFKHSKTYSRLANECVDNLIDRTKDTNRRSAALHQSMMQSEQFTRSTMCQAEDSKMVGNNGESESVNALPAAPYGKYKDVDPGSLYRKKADEPPIPGYTGHVPRINATQIGVGSRYHVISDEGLDDFWTRYTLKFGEQFPGDLNNRHPVRWPTQSFMDDSIRKTYYQDGMLPKFRGHVPQVNYRHGRTFGDTTRQLDVCKYPKTYETYGEYLRRARDENNTNEKVKSIADQSKQFQRMGTVI